MYASIARRTAALILDLVIDLVNPPTLYIGTVDFAIMKLTQEAP